MTKAQLLRYIDLKLERAYEDIKWGNEPGEAYWDAYTDGVLSVQSLVQLLDGDS